MFDKARVKADFEKSAEKYDAHAQLQLQVAREVYARAGALFPDDAQVLDAGCGTGFIAGLASGNGWDVAQLDLAFDMCLHAREKGAVVNGDIDVLPFTDAQFDGVTSSLVFQWISDPAAAFAELRRVLRPGGHLALSTFGPETLRELKTVFERIDDHGHITQFLTGEALMEAAKRAGLQDISLHSEIVTQHFPDARVLMKKITVIGASNKNPDRRRTLTSKALFDKLEQIYQLLYTAPDGLPATWEILYLTAKRA